ncbi:GntR family transcriptional regulator [Amycolatopsis sp. NPDC024027]|uniref:GntR family transcriptional regulator n=1 Tax=Amycolatopsis sp. NPDC024027 TaxID=3154327 RepID=UPI0033C18501
MASGELAVGEQLSPAAEPAGALSVDRNTVPAAYRRLRDEGVLEFRRGRGARVASASPSRLRSPMRHRRSSPWPAGTAWGATT